MWGMQKQTKNGKSTTIIDNMVIKEGCGGSPRQMWSGVETGLPVSICQVVLVFSL